MSIQNCIRVIDKIEKFLSDDLSNYAKEAGPTSELLKLQAVLHDLQLYLKKLDNLHPHYDTGTINDYMKAIDLHLDLLKELLAKDAYKQLASRVTVLKRLLKFHPTKYSTLAFAYAWVLEWLYFI